MRAVGEGAGDGEEGLELGGELALTEAEGVGHEALESAVVEPEDMALLVKQGGEQIDAA